MHFSAASTVSNLLGPKYKHSELQNSAYMDARMVDTHNTNPYPLSLSLTCLVKVRTLRMGPYGAASANNWSSGKCGGRPFMYTLEVFRVSRLVEALLVEPGPGSGYESRAVWTGGFENGCLLSPERLALLGLCG